MYSIPGLKINACIWFYSYVQMKACHSQVNSLECLVSYQSVDRLIELYRVLISLKIVI